MKTINNWKLLLLTALAGCAAACTDDPDEVPVIELGAVKGEYIVPAQSGTVEVEVYSNRGCNVSFLEATPWAEAHTGRIPGDGAFSVTYGANDSFARVARLLLQDDSGRRRDTVYIRQEGLIEERLVFPAPNISVKGSAAEGSVSVPLDTNIGSERLTTKVVYPDENASGWISDVRIDDAAGRLLFATQANPDQENMRSAEITLSFTNGWDKVTATKLYIVQANARDDFGTEKTFAEIRALCGPGQVVTIENDYYISAWVVSDAAGGNMGANPMTTESTINYEMCKKTAYVESIDGSMGFLIETETADDNIFMRYSRIQLSLKGVRLVHDTDPGRFALKGVKSAMIISSELGSAADIPHKEKRISQLTDDDIYTYVTLTDCELPIRKGPLTPINEGYANATGANRTEKCASLVRDIEGEHIYLYTNTTCLYRRDGSRLPYGSGKLSGIVVHELFPRFEWEDNASGDDESYGYIGRYQLRHVSKSDFDGLADDFEESFSALLTEYRFLQYDNNKVYPTYGTNGYLTHSYKDGTGAIKILANEDFSYLGPVGNKSSFIFGSNIGNVNGMGIILEDGTDWWRDFADVNNNTSGDTSGGGKGKVPRKNNAEGPAWVDWYWWDKANDRGHAWIVNFSTEGISTDVLSMQVSVLNDRYDSGKYGSPRYFDVAWSETGDMNADGDWTYIASYTVPDMARWSPATRYWQYAGWKPVDVKLPLEMLGRKNVYIRLQAARNLGGSLDEYAAQPIDSPSCMNYFAIRYNKK